MVFQEQLILPSLTVAENIFLGREEEFLRYGLISKSRMNEAARERIAQGPSRRASRQALRRPYLCRSANGGDRQGAVARQPDQGRCDDPPRRADLGVGEEGDRSAVRDRRDLKQRASIVFISHRLEEVLEISDRVYVMRDGKVVFETPAKDATVKALHQHMVGRQLHHEYYREARQAAATAVPVLVVRALPKRGGFSNVSFTLHEGEIIGIAGVIGSGREDLARCLAGHKPADAGNIEGRWQVSCPSGRPTMRLHAGLVWCRASARSRGWSPLSA